MQLGRKTDVTPYLPCWHTPPRYVASTAAKRPTRRAERRCALMGGAGFRAIRWARELPTLLHNGRVDRVAHHVALLLASYADNDGGNITVSPDTVAREAHAPAGQVAAALGRLEAAGLLETAVARGGIGGWRLVLAAELPEGDVVVERAQRQREVTAERVRKHRANHPRVTHKNTVTVTQDSTVTVTQENTVTNGSVTHNSTVTDPHVTHKCNGGNAQDTVTPAGQMGCTSINLHKEDLQKQHTTPTARAVDEPQTSPDDDRNGALPLPGLDPQVEPPQPPAKIGNGYSLEFEAFWVAYRAGVVAGGRSPGGKFAASKAWARAMKLVSADTVLAAIPAYHASEKPQRGYMQDAATWLNQRGWAEEYTPYRHLQAVGGYTPYRNPIDVSAYYAEL